MGAPAAGGPAWKAPERRMSRPSSSSTPVRGTASQRWACSGSGPVSSLPGMSTMIANTKSTAMARVDDDLDEGQELRLKHQVQRGHPGQVDGEEQRRVDGVA